MNESFYSCQKLTAVSVLSVVSLFGCQSRDFNPNQNAGFSQANTTDSWMPRLKTALNPPCTGTLSGEKSPFECVPSSEFAEVESAKKIAIAQVRTKRTKETSPQALTRRDAHARPHGCVKGTFVVGNNVPAEMQKGPFKTSAANFNVWSRFSAAGVKPDAKDDTKTDIQGFALKIIGVPGKKLIDEGTQESNGFDLLLANVPFFLAKDVKEYNEQLSLNSPDIDIFTKGRILFTVLPRLNRAIGMSKTQNPFSDIYSSVSTYQIEQNMVNYRAVPCANQTHMAGPEGATKFRTAMQLSMTQGNGACFELEARKALTPSYLMAEDVTKTWEEHITTALEKVPEAKGNSVFEKTIGPWVSLGQISFPVQTFESEGQMNFCEAMSFNPWRTLPEMRPLGGLNRARKSVYKAVFDTRKADNSWKDIPEPTGTESF